MKVHFFMISLRPFKHIQVVTLFNDESTFLEEVAIDYDNKVPIYDDYGDDMYAILNNYNHETCHHVSASSAPQ